MQVHRLWLKLMMFFCVRGPQGFYLVKVYIGGLTRYIRKRVFDWMSILYITGYIYPRNITHYWQANALACQ